MSGRLITYEQLLPEKGLSYSKPHLWRMEKAGNFPKRVPVGENRYAYVTAEIDEYIEQKIRERNAGAKIKPKRQDQQGSGD